MDEDTVIAVFAALAHRVRLAIFRRLVAAGPDGLTAGALAIALAMPASSLSHHLGALDDAGLVGVRRAGRALHYNANLALIPFITRFLTEDCCDGRPEAKGFAASAAMRSSGSA